jgi:hypothetical protein
MENQTIIDGHPHGINLLTFQFISNSNLIMSRTRQSPPSGSEEASIFRIPPYYYLHVFDQTTNVTKVEIGPKTFIRQDNEKVDSLCCFFRVIQLYLTSKFQVISQTLYL